MAQSLVKLTLESNQYEKNLRQAQKALDDFTKKIGINAKSLTGVAIAATAVTGSIKVFGDALKSNEVIMDGWRQTIKSAESVYEGFLNALNTGDFSGFLHSINSIISAAKSAYAALDELGTYNAFNQVNIAEKRTNLTEAMADYRMGRGSKDDVKKAASEYQAELRTRMQLEEESYIEEVKRIAATRNVNADMLMDAMSGSWGHYKKLKDVQPTGERNGYTPGSSMFGQGGSFYTVKYAVTEEEKLGQMLRNFTDEELEKLQKLGAQYKITGNEIASVDKQVARIVSSSTGGNTERSRKAKETYAEGSIAAQKALIAELTKLWENAGDEGVRNGYHKQLKEAQITLAKMQEGGRKFLTADTTIMKSGQLFTSGKEDLNKMVSQLKLPTGNKELKIAYADKEFSNISSGISSMVGSLEQLGIEIPEGLSQVVSGIQAVTTILSAISTIVMAIQTLQTADLIIPSWLARGGLVHAAGGVFVPGNSYSGDRVPAMLNSGELVLNKAQQGNLASQLEGGALGNLRLSATISGEQIRLALNNNGRRTGRGEMITAKFGG